MRLGAHPFTLRQLQYAVAVAETKSFRRAAERAHVSQPSLSAQIAELETAIGVRLFERDRRGVLVTPAGEELIARATRVLLDVEDLQDAAKRHIDPLTGTLRIGVIPTLAPYLVPEVDPALRATFDRLTLLWTEDKTPVLVDRIQLGELDAALMALEANLGDLEYEVLGKDPFLLATAKNHRLAGSAKSVRLEDLEGERVLLLDEGHCLRDQALDLCSGAGAEELGFRATSLSTLSQMVASGTGVTLLPKLAAPVENRRGLLSLRRFGNPAPHRTIVLAWRRRSALSESLKQVAARARIAFAAIMSS
jgi:LysR family transcriptional regulator, hydrogen peroxide-inducible genes activator